MKTISPLAHTALALALPFLFAACSAQTSSDTPPPVVIEKSGQADPVELTLADEKPMSYSGRIAVNQADSHANIFITQPVDTVIEIGSATATAEGCPAGQVLPQAVWFEEANQSSGHQIPAGMSFAARANMRGLLQFQFLKLTGCNHVSYTILLAKKKLAPVGPFDVDGAAEVSQ